MPAPAVRMVLFLDRRDRNSMINRRNTWNILQYMDISLSIVISSAHLSETLFLYHKIAPKTADVENDTFHDENSTLRHKIYLFFGLKKYLFF